MCPDARDRAFYALGIGRSHPGFSDLDKAWRTTDSAAFFDRAMILPFYRAPALTRTCTFIRTPLIGSPGLFWRIDSRGTLGTFIQHLGKAPDLPFRASTPLVWISRITHGVWSIAPFVAPIQLMDNPQTLEPIIGLQAQAHAPSLSVFLVSDLGEMRQLFPAAASWVLAIIDVAILRPPVLVRSWRDFKAKT